MSLSAGMAKNINKIKRRDLAKEKSKKSGKKKRSPEAILQDEMIKHYKARGFMVIRHNSYAGITETGTYLKAYTVCNYGGNAGLSDLTIGKDGKLVYLEVKTGYNKQTWSQERFQQECEKFGMPYIAAYSIEEADKFINKIFGE